MNPSRSESAPEGLLHQDYFALFGLPPGFSLEPAALEAAWKVLQRAAHPDRFARADDAQKRLALQWSTRINEAYAVLKDPLQRAEYLCGLWGVAIDAQSNTQMPVEFLETQMMLREEFDDLQRMPQSPERQVAIDRLRAICSQQMAAGITELTLLFDGVSTEISSADDPAAVNRLQAAAMQVRALMFVKKFQTELG
ncbi:MAG: Fe-S protein assembly co-chaperone HscB [Pseudomonadota bacterium]